MNLLMDVPIEKAFHALSDPLRLKILDHLRQQEYCVGDLCNSLDVNQSKLSFHLRVLKDAGIVRSHSEGRWIYYSLNLPQIVALEQHLADFRYRYTHRLSSRELPQDN